MTEEEARRLKRALDSYGIGTLVWEVPVHGTNYYCVYIKIEDQWHELCDAENERPEGKEAVFA